MSGPTRGMVAGQAITTQAQTKEFDEGFDRIFGKVKPKKGRTVYTSGGEPLPEPIEVGDDYTGAERRAQTPTEGLVYGNLGKAQTGEPIDSRAKHRNYMKQNGLTLESDYSDSYRAKEKASKERADNKSRRETVARAYYTKFKP